MPWFSFLQFDAPMNNQNEPYQMHNNKASPDDWSSNYKEQLDMISRSYNRSVLPKYGLMISIILVAVFCQFLILMEVDNNRVRGPQNIIIRRSLVVKVKRLVFRLQENSKSSVVLFMSLHFLTNKIVYGALLAIRGSSYNFTRTLTDALVLVCLISFIDYFQERRRQTVLQLLRNCALNLFLLFYQRKTVSNRIANLCLLLLKGVFQALIFGFSLADMRMQIGKKREKSNRFSNQVLVEHQLKIANFHF